MTIYLFGEVQPHRKSCHFLIRARESRIKLCAVGMRNTILGNDLNSWGSKISHGCENVHLMLSREQVNMLTAPC